jgi:hypothetical protein
LVAIVGVALFALLRFGGLALLRPVMPLLLLASLLASLLYIGRVREWW